MTARNNHCATVPGAPVAQSVEQRTFNPRAVRSKLTGGTISLDLLPLRMRARIQLEVSPICGLSGFCWGWTGAATSRGYGSISYQSRVWSTHKLAYVLTVGAVPNGLQLDHLCCNKLCCNPAHLEPVTSKVNVGRAWPATKLRCVNGHPLAAPNLRLRSRAGGLVARDCRACRMAEKSRYDDERGRKRRPSQSVAWRRSMMLAESEAALRLLNSEATS